MNTSTHSARISYIAGFVMSLALTFAAYSLVTGQVFEKSWLVAAIIGLAIIQLLVQLIFFLHLGAEPKPRFNILVLIFATLVLIILVFGSLWIMSNLNYHMVPPSDGASYIIHDEGIHTANP